MPRARSKSPPPLLKRVPTGIPGLDTIWRGGFHRGGIYLIFGKPGAGKTILGNQICFNHAGSGEKALFVTLLTESHARMLSHLKAFDFFNPQHVGSSLKYVSGYQVLENDKLPGLRTFLQKTIRETKATLLVIDGLVTAGAIAESQLELKKFIHELQVFIELMGCTAFLLAGESSEMDQYAVRTMADGMIEMGFERVGMSGARTIEVVKFRPGPFLMGRHCFEITDRGITVYPRIETILGNTPERPTLNVRDKLSFGVKSLDKLMGGGMHPASVTMLLGSSGSGKTLLGLSYLAAGVRKKEPGLYFGFSETPADLLRNAAELNPALSRQLKSKLIEFSWQSPSEGAIPDAMAEKLIAIVKERGIRRLFIDGIGGFRNPLLKPERATDFFSALCNELRVLGVAAMFSEETNDLFGPQIEIPVSGLAPMLDNILLLRHVELHARLHRLLSVMKMRGGQADSSLREFSIKAGRIEVSPTFDSAEAILSGIARMRKDARPSPSPTTERHRRGSGE